MTENVFELRDVILAYDGRTVLDIPQLSVRRGEILTLLGENGSGKTTLLRVLGLLIRPNRGSVVFGGEEIDYRNPRSILKQRRRMAAVMQEPLLCRMSVRRNVALGLRFRGLGKSTIEDRTNVWLDKLSIRHLADRPAAKLSGGEAQRASLARAMVLQPEVLLMDEPFGSLDAPTRQGMLQEFEAVLAESGVAAVFATHDRGEALRLGDRVAVLTHGRVAQLGSPDSVFSSPRQVEIASFLGIETLIPGTVAQEIGDILQVDCGPICVCAQGEGEIGDDVYVAVRSEEIDIIPTAEPSSTDSRNALPGLVTRLVAAETHYRVELDCGVKVVAFVSRVKVRDMGLDTGHRVQAAFAPRSAHLIRRVSD